MSRTEVQAPHTKPSGIPWLGEVPAHWEVKRLKDIADVRFSNVDKKTEEGEIPVRLCNYTDVYYGHYLDGTPEYMEATATRSEIERFKLRKGDVLITKDSESPTDIAIAAMVVENVPDLVCGYHLAMIRADRDQIEPAFLYWQFLSDQVREQYYPLANGITRFALGHGEINGGAFVLPPLPEQRAIAAFLDERTARIDALVARKRRLVQLLKEKRQALITRAVTRGLDPKAKMKESGVPWLGEVPEGWETQKFGRVVSITEGQVNPEVEPYVDMLLIAPNHIESRSGKLLAQETAAEQAAESGKYLCPVGAVIYSKIRPALRKATIAPEACLCSADMYPMVGINGMTNGYLLWLLLSEAFSDWVVLDSDRVAMPKVNRETLNTYWLPLPPFIEQDAIVTYITEQTTRLDALVTKVEQAVERLQEYRTALISAAVTGKVRVPNTE